MKATIKKHAEKIRYIIVGGFNTFLDFLILFVLVAFGLDKIPANYISTTVTMIISFFLNKSFTFKSKDGNSRKQFALFIIITASGLWVIQPVIIIFITWATSSLNLPAPISLFIAKCIATVATLVWNYFWYSRAIFKKKS